MLLRIYVNENKVERQKEVGGFLKKSLLVISDYPDHEMCCFKRKMSAPTRVIDSKP